MQVIKTGPYAAIFYGDRLFAAELRHGQWHVKRVDGTGPTGRLANFLAVLAWVALVSQFYRLVRPA